MNSIIKLSTLKELIYSSFKDFFIDEGFKANKARMSFTKTCESYKIEFLFHFNDYYPNYNEYNFVCFIFLKKLDDIIDEFKKFVNSKIILQPNIVIYEGEFILDLYGKKRKFAMAYNNEVNSQPSAEASIDQTLEIIKNHALPKAYLLSTFEGFQEYFFNDPKSIAERITEYGFILSSLIIAHLQDQEMYDSLRILIRDELDKCTFEGLELPSSYILLENLDAFFNSRN